MSRVGLALTVVLLLAIVTMTFAAPSSRNYERYGQGHVEYHAQVQGTVCDEYKEWCMRVGVRTPEYCEQGQRECEVQRTVC